MKSIPFTRFHLPDGRRSETEIEVTDAEFVQFEKVRAAGFRMTVELLQNGMVSQCVEDPELGDFDCVVTANGPQVTVELSKMLLRFDPKVAAKWKEVMS